MDGDERAGGMAGSLDDEHVATRRCRSPQANRASSDTAVDNARATPQDPANMQRVGVDWYPQPLADGRSQHTLPEVDVPERNHCRRHTLREVPRQVSRL